MTNDDFIKSLAEALEVEKVEYPDAQDLVELGWDSLVQLAFISALDSKYGCRVDARELNTVETVGELRELVVN